MKLSVNVPQVTNTSSAHNTFISFFINDIMPKTKRITSVTIASILAKAHEDKPLASTLMIFTKKSSLISCKTVINKFAKNSSNNTGIKLLKICMRPSRFNVTRSVRNFLSSSVG